MKYKSGITMSAYQKIALLAPGNACESRVFTYTAKGRVVGAAYTT